MVRSMTGYGKSEYLHGNAKYTIEIRSLNGKNADISIKTSLIPREKEIEVRQYIIKALNRGNIDLFISIDKNEQEAGKIINKNILTNYYQQIKDIQNELGLEESPYLINTLVKMPDVIEIKKDELTQESWTGLLNGIKDSCKALTEFREKEGEILKQEITKRIEAIEKYVIEVEKYEEERIKHIRQRIQTKIDELNTNLDDNRLEQELIYYVEKLDITEEKVRLRHHCKYFIETLNIEDFSGKKIGFIAQEIGREINTMGSKANQADMQQWVVKMKDELEKIKEQALNIL